MAITINSLDTLRQYLNSLMGRADHHADNVNEIALTLIGGVIWRSTNEVQVKQYDGAPGNILWMTVNHRRYCFVYNHVTEQVEIRDGSMKGAVMHTFDNSTPVSIVKQIFEGL